MPLEAVEPRRLYRQVADQLRALIDRGEFRVGDRLPPERDLAASLNVSRATVREALIALEVDGRVRIRVGSGIYVTPVTEAAAPTAPPIAGPFEVLAARALIEGAIAESVAAEATSADIAALDAILASMQAPHSGGTTNLELDRAFHIALARMTGNDALVNVVGDLFDQRIHPYFRQLAGYFESDDSWRKALAEHRAVRDALAARDPARARRTMEAHLSRSGQRFSETFGEGRPVAPAPSSRPAGEPRAPRIRRIASQ